MKHMVSEKEWEMINMNLKKKSLVSQKYLA